MAILTQVFFSVGGTDISANVRSLDVPQPVAAVDATAMGADNATSMEAGLKDWTISGTVKATYGSGGTLETFNDVYRLQNRQAALEVRRNTSAVSTTNPKWTGTGVLETFQPLSGAIGQLHEITFTFRPTTDLTRATA